MCLRLWNWSADRENKPCLLYISYVDRRPSRLKIDISTSSYFWRQGLGGTNHSHYIENSLGKTDVFLKNFLYHICNLTRKSNQIEIIVLFSNLGAANIVKPTSELMKPAHGGVILFRCGIMLKASVHFPGPKVFNKYASDTKSKRLLGSNGCQKTWCRCVCGLSKVKNDKGRNVFLR